ncbi:MAG TPA: GNAT family N-acetyltransferase [Thermoplasmata archaeon]|nr:GNAT family N-acetyltransferase [Thermoplasmata archaeon]
MVRYFPAESKESVEQIRKLFLEYAGSLGFKLCFQDFDKEIASLPGEYARPNGRLYLAFERSRPVGCVGLRGLEEGVCEMKRLYVKPNNRREGIGRELAELVIRDARDIGYSKMRLDTIAAMMPAITLYKSLGFKEIPPYRYNPIASAIYLELDLKE